MMANTQRFFTTLTIVLLAGSLFSNLSGSLSRPAITFAGGVNYLSPTYRRRGPRC